MNDLGWIDAVLTSARPQVMGALLRYFRDLDLAEEAFQEACLRALRTWPQNGPPRRAGVADLRRPQRGDGRCAPPRQAGGAA